MPWSLAARHENTSLLGVETGAALLVAGLGVVVTAGAAEPAAAAYVLREIGRNYLDQRRFAAAEPFLRRGLDIRQKKLETRHPDLGKSTDLDGEMSDRAGAL